jgi:hypothetical protein
MTQTTLTAAELRDKLLAEIAAAPYRGTIAKWAQRRAPGVRLARVYGFIRGSEPPSEDLLRAVGYEKVIVYKELL